MEIEQETAAFGFFQDNNFSSKIFPDISSIKIQKNRNKRLKT